MTDLAWLETLPDQAARFLLNMRGLSTPGYFRYSYSADRYDESRHWNVGASVFALKILYCLNLREPDLIAATCARVASFKRASGEIYDDLVFYQGWPRAVLSGLKRTDPDTLLNRHYKRAETRQCYSALALHRQVPRNPLALCPTQAAAIERYLQALDWRQPWAAGSHFSHLLFFLQLARQTGALSEAEHAALLDHATVWINRLQHPEDGAWYQGNPTPREKINGAMKIITGLVAIDSPEFAYPERLIDLCLSAVNDQSACDHFNVVYVLHYASRLLNRQYRQAEIEQFCLARLAGYRRHFHPELGGFSFHPRLNNRCYYGATIAAGKAEPDIHGTVLFLWGISILVQMLGVAEHFPFREFKT